MYEFKLLVDAINDNAGQAHLAHLAAQVQARMDAERADRERYNHRAYWSDVEAIARDVYDEIGDDDGEAYDRIHESVDGSQWIIYTYLARKVLEHTDNDDAWEAIGDLPTGRGFDAIVSYVACAAMIADVSDKYREICDEASDSE
jgi:hypothetical protein